VAAPENRPPAAFNLAEVTPAAFFARFGALLIDWALCLVVGGLAGAALIRWAALVVLVVLNTITIGLFGRTPGMTLAGIRCVSIVDGGAIGLAGRCCGPYSWRW
jgi:uncharacterized RDD family membrane protein YckC